MQAEPSKSQRLDPSAFGALRHVHLVCSERWSVNRISSSQTCSVDFSQGIQTYAVRLSKLYQGGVARKANPGAYLYALEAANRPCRAPRRHTATLPRMKPLAGAPGDL